METPEALVAGTPKALMPVMRIPEAVDMEIPKALTMRSGECLGGWLRVDVCGSKYQGYLKKAGD